MSNVGVDSGDKLQRPLSPKPGDDRRPPATANLADSNRYHETTTAHVPSIKIPTEEAKAAALRAPARVKRATGFHTTLVAAGGATDVLRALENRHRWLLFAQHCYTCTRPEGACDLGKLCIYGKKTLNHVAQCKKEECPYPRCRLLKPLLQHSRRCQSSTCAICVPVWNYIQKDNQQQQQQLQQPSQPLPPAQHETQQQQQQQKQPTQRAQPGNGVNEHGPSTLWPQSVINASAAPPALQRCPEPALARTVGLDKAEGGASTSGASRHPTGGSAAAGAAPTAGADGRLSSTGTAGLAAGGASAGAGGSGAVGQGPRGDPGLGKLAIVDRLDGPAAPDAKAAGVHQHQQALAAAAAPTGGPAVGSAGTHHYMSLTSSPLSPYGIPPYASSLPAAPGGPHADSAERPRTAGITITATPTQPIPVANRPNVPATVKTAAVAGQQPQLIHSYPPSTSIGAFFPQLTHHHAAANVAAPAAPAIATHWLPLQGLAAMPATMGNSAPASNGVANGAGGSGLMGSSPTPAAAPPTAVWANAAPMRPGGPVAMYGISTDAVRPNGLGAMGPVAPLQTVDRYGHPQYTLAGVNGSSAISPAGTITMAAAPLLLWPGGHPAPPPGAAAAPQQVGAHAGHVPTHLAAPAPYTMAPMNGARISAGTTTLAVGAPGGTAVAGLPAPTATALMSGPQMPPHALLYGHPSLGAAPAGGGNPAGGALGTDISPGATALWSYVLR